VAGLHAAFDWGWASSIVVGADVVVGGVAASVVVSVVVVSVVVASVVVVSVVVVSVVVASVLVASVVVASVVVVGQVGALQALCSVHSISFGQGYPPNSGTMQDLILVCVPISMVPHSCTEHSLHSPHSDALPFFVFGPATQ